MGEGWNSGKNRARGLLSVIITDVKLVELSKDIKVAVEEWCRVSVRSEGFKTVNGSVNGKILSFSAAKGAANEEKEKTITCYGVVRIIVVAYKIEGVKV